MDRENELLEATAGRINDGLFDDLSVLDGGFELGERAVEQAELVEGVLADELRMKPHLRPSGTGSAMRIHCPSRTERQVDHSAEVFRRRAIRREPALPVFFRSTCGPWPWRCATAATLELASRSSLNVNFRSARTEPSNR